eukprot:TRINITY_DN3584_c0_g1_i1.p1 TRINITY_DN3584_c0_g1~~TRINITY_DN3584_c0_g1_i1.p1  ORF type:complete len:387 (+),score=65.75 TRINITY_DN3584_c0_g1_i1:156-1316(+)
MNELAFAYPSVIPFVEKSNDFLNNKLYHQLGSALEVIFSLPEITSSSTSLLSFFKSFVLPIHGFLNPYVTAKLAVLATRQEYDTVKAKELLEKVRDELPGDTLATDEGKILLSCESLRRQLTMETLSTVRKESRIIAGALSKLAGVSAPTNAAFFHLLACIAERESDSTQFYKNAVAQISFLPKETSAVGLTPEMMQLSTQLAYRTALSCLISPNIFSFGAFLASDAADLLSGPYEFIKHFLTSLHQGDIVRYREVRATADAAIAADQVLLANIAVIDRKASMMAFVALAFKLPAHSRVISFEDASSASGLAVSEVERMVMRCVSRGLIKATMDEVAKKIEVTWVTPRVLLKEQISDLRERLSSWRDDVTETYSKLLPVTPSPLWP